MKVVDKYGLAKQPLCTAFYDIDKYGNITSGLKVLMNTDSYTSDNPLFTEIYVMEPDLDLGNMDSDIYIGQEIGLGDIKCGDDCSIDHDDNEMFLVLMKEEALRILNITKSIVDAVDAEGIDYYL